MSLQEQRTTVNEIEQHPEADAIFRRLLMVVDGSECAGAAIEFARGWVDGFGGEIRCVAIEEHGRSWARRLRMPAERGDAVSLVAEGRRLAARNRSIVAGVTQAAVAFRADVIVLGCDHRRLARRRLCASLRDRLAAATDLPVVVAPAGARRDQELAHEPGRTAAPGVLHKDGYVRV